MRLPNGEQAVVDPAKLSEYCLNPLHPVGKHKARVFAAVLGLTAASADVLRDALLEAAQTEEAIASETDQYGQRYTVDFSVAGPNGHTVVRRGWIIRAGESSPRLTTCYVL